MTSFSIFLRIMKRLGWIVVFTLSFSISVLAQQLKVFRVESISDDPFDFSARGDGTKKLDGNGDLYAILKITTDDPADDLRSYNFDFGMLNCIVDVHECEGEIWVYVQKNAKRVTISRSGFRTISRYDLQRTFLPGNVYRMKLSVDSMSEQIYSQILEFNITPHQSGAIVTYRSETSGTDKIVFGTTDVNGAVARSMKLGTYYYEVVANHYHTSEGMIVLDEKNGHHIENVVLNPNFAKVVLNASEDVDIYINGEKIGVQSWSGKLYPDTYQIECRKENHKNTYQIFEFREGESYNITLIQPKPIVGSLTLFSNPLGAEITIDGKNYGKTPKFIGDLLIGRHLVSLTMPKYKTVWREIEIKEGENYEDNVIMLLEDQYASESINNEGNSVSLSEPNSKSEIILNNSQSQDLLSNDNTYLDIGGQLISMNGIYAAVGKYFKNFNLETFYNYGLDRQIGYLVYPQEHLSVEQTMKCMSYGLKLGYGICAWNRMRFTPQFGMGVLNVYSADLNSFAITSTLNCRFEFAITKWLGVSIVPEFSFAVHRSALYQDMSEMFPKVKQWGNGFNLRGGLIFMF